MDWKENQVVTILYYLVGLFRRRPKVSGRSSWGSCSPPEHRQDRQTVWETETVSVASEITRTTDKKSRKLNSWDRAEEKNSRREGEMQRQEDSWQFLAFLTTLLCTSGEVDSSTWSLMIVWPTSSSAHSGNTILSVWKILARQLCQVRDNKTGLICVCVFLFNYLNKQLESTYTKHLYQTQSDNRKLCGQSVVVWLWVWIPEQTFWVNLWNSSWYQALHAADWTETTNTIPGQSMWTHHSIKSINFKARENKSYHTWS